MSSQITNTLSLPSQAISQLQLAGSDELLLAIHDRQLKREQMLVLGSGSNVVLPAQLPKHVVTITDRSIAVVDEDENSVVIEVGAGKDWHELVLETLEAGWFGLENLALIPGLVGAAPVQNIGAYGRELSGCLLAVSGVDLVARAIRTLDANACELRYRDSVFKGRLRDRFVITSVRLSLNKKAHVNADYPSLARALAVSASSPTPMEVCEAVISTREDRLPDPAEIPNAGSFFKNPVLDDRPAERLRTEFPECPLFEAGGSFKSSAAWMIDQCGLRGFSMGPAGMSAKHALVLVNHGRAQQADVLALAAHVQAVVAQRFGVTLSIEPRVYPDE
ncbi:MAG: UDP-N-acetylmuramate dehydrogenase [Pseudomonadota bacterium]